MGFAGIAAAQPVSAGFKIGAPLTDAFSISSNPTLGAITGDAKDYTFGPYVEVKLPFKFSIEGDALYRGYNFTAGSLSTSPHSWDFPIVAKYHFLKGPIKPYVEGGLSFSHLSDVSSVLTPNHLTNTGIVIGGGVQLNLLLLKISPELRYTGYALKDFTGIVDSNRNQVAFLVGIGF